MDPLFAYIKANTAAGTAATPTVSLPFGTGKFDIVSAEFSPSAATAANGTNYATLTIKTNDGAGGSFSSASTGMSTASTAMAVGTTRNFTLDSDAKGLAGGSCIQVDVAHTGTGAAIDGFVCIEYRKVS